MRILVLAPQPFFQERGTPIAVRLASEVLAARSDEKVDLLTYHEGKDLEIPNVKHHRIRPFPSVSGVTPGFSFKKLYCDLFFFCKLIALLIRGRREGQYDIIHAVEESVFMAWILKPIFGVPFIYDMDSSLSLQLIEKFPALSFLEPILQFFERAAIRSSVAVVPVCDALAVIAEAQGSRMTHILRDISLLDDSREPDDPTNIREKLALSQETVLALYVGNLEKYQGIDLLLDGFAAVYGKTKSLALVIIGGKPSDIELYERKAKALGIAERTFFLGPRPVKHLAFYLRQADILPSPRSLGNNTPMKIYSYLHSGSTILATRLPTHTQVLDDSVALLTPPEAEPFGEGLYKLASDKELRERLGQAAATLAEEKYTFRIFQKRLNELYDQIGS